MKFSEIYEAHVSYDDDEDMVNAAKQICRDIMEYARDKPIDIEVQPEMVHGHCHGVVLTDLFATEPGSGVGKPLMRYLIKLCDDAGLNLYTDAEGPRSAEFYTKLGADRDGRGRHQFVWYPDISEDFPHLYESESEYPDTLDAEELVDYAMEHIHADEIGEVSDDFIRDMLDGASARLVKVPIENLILNGGVEVSWRTEEYSKLDTDAPPIIIDGKKVVDGNHRIREAIKRKQTHILAYRLYHDDEPF